MRTIPQTFGKTGRHYELDRRSAHACIYRVYRQTSSGTGPLLGYETHVIRFYPEGQWLGRTIEASERLGSNEDLGRYAWSFSGPNALARAVERFNRLQERPADAEPDVQVNAISPGPIPGHPPDGFAASPQPRREPAGVPVLMS
jgi:hypothetical protein